MKYNFKHVKNIYQTIFHKSESSKMRSKRKAESFKCMFSYIFAIVFFKHISYACVCGKVSSLSGENRFSLHANLFTFRCVKNVCRVLMHVKYMYTLNACYVASHYGWKILISKEQSVAIAKVLLVFFFISCCFFWMTWRWYFILD